MAVYSLKTSSYAQVSDEMIWIAFQNDNKEALASLYFRYFKILTRYGCKITSDKGLVKDCIHDLFVEVWNSRKNLAVPRSVKAYLLTCVQRKLIRFRKRKRAAQVEVNTLPDIQLVDSKEDQLISDQYLAQQQKVLKHAIDGLTKRQQEAIYLKFYANLSYDEIVDVMNISADAIYNLVSKSIDILQKNVPTLGR